jgi:hypothetical protein
MFVLCHIRLGGPIRFHPISLPPALPPNCPPSILSEMCIFCAKSTKTKNSFPSKFYALQCKTWHSFVAFTPEINPVNFEWQSWLNMEFFRSVNTLSNLNILLCGSFVNGTLHLIREKELKRRGKRDRESELFLWLGVALSHNLFLQHVHRNKFIQI